MLATFVIVMSLSFALIRLMPGGPAALIRARLETSERPLSQEQIAARVELFTSVNPDKPIPEAYYDYVTATLTGDLGQSIWYDRTVAEILADAMPWTIFLSAVSMLLIYVIGIGLGALMAYYEASKFDFSSSLVSIVITSVPYYVVAVGLLWFLAYQLGWFPTGGRVDPTLEPGLTVQFVQSVLHHGLLPIGSLVIAGFGGTALSMRGNAIQVLGNDYLRVARLRGLSERRISLTYVARNSILPMYTGIMISIGGLFGGSIILEQIFTYRGAGYYVFSSLGARDYPLLMGGFLLITLGVVVGVYIADLTYGLVDPRAGSGANRESF
ncbi:ABC transporter permease [Haloarchaeobius sp. TZWSO28]|uniref:ABC transporter permease n=1 Tax=Haloarchaeobius sp. TZWSO28 TaxID=3446119 RepID=UPI003EC08756